MCDFVHIRVCGVSNGEGFATSCMVCELSASLCCLFEFTILSCKNEQENHIFMCICKTYFISDTSSLPLLTFVPK